MYELIGCLFVLCVVVIFFSLIIYHNNLMSIIEENDLLIKEIRKEAIFLIEKLKEQQRYIGEE